MTGTTTPSILKSRSLVKLIEDRQVELGLTDEHIAAAVGFERSGIMSLIKTGALRFPMTKIPALAKVLGVEPSIILVTALQENSPDLLNLIEEVWGPRDLTPEEGRLVQACRKLANGRKVAPIVFMSPVVGLVTV
ncbi:MAG: hypothetical protein ACD_34C00076G0002 [uncultured bacterium]|nr:MAG: hypothetical protein ACD_34C00076G0002 [uncultured bacterium]